MANKYAEYGHPCPIRDVLDRIGDQWSLLILESLASKAFRFNELHREIGDISRQMLTVTLKRLEFDGYISRTVFAEVPTRVEYRLTVLGESFLQPLRQLVDWADSHHEAICYARKTNGGALVTD
ncbi:helix-turn-helix transcriptional regulator [Rosenbergiella sp. S61]|uniref:Helix-turn-helix transcriptional regulator n=1 Tax=Rosenbergiella gaditana TaxID=2726987 RepID=A0ABS5SZY7_9GAMM|nr:helix-turn-helix domain-containing protein [Rosenbergiella gaditana]MBT0725675.1 helix-turn-helix transcriptional regulator [Rosenbergiella gaditana]